MPGVQHRRLLARSFSHILPSRFFMLKLIVFKTEKFFSRTMSKLFVSALSKTFLFRKESDTCLVCYILLTWSIEYNEKCNCELYTLHYCTLHYCTLSCLGNLVLGTSLGLTLHLQLSWGGERRGFTLHNWILCGHCDGESGLESGDQYLHSSEIIVPHSPHSSHLNTNQLAGIFKTKSTASSSPEPGLNFFRNLVAVTEVVKTCSFLIISISLTGQVLSIRIDWRARPHLLYASQLFLMGISR